MAFDIPIIKAEIIKNIFLFIHRKGRLNAPNRLRLLLFCLYMLKMINDLTFDLSLPQKGLHKLEPMAAYAMYKLG